MATGKISNKCIDDFFRAVSKGSVCELQELLKKIKPHEEAMVVNSFNSGGETPLLVAIKENHHQMVRFLIDELNTDVFKTGRFNWKGMEYLQALPLFAATLSDFTSDQGIIKFLVAKSTVDVTVLKSFVMTAKIPPSQKIDVLELMGAAFIAYLNLANWGGRIELGIRCWESALNIRFNSENPLDPILKTPNSFSPSVKKVLGASTEFRTLDELQEIANSPEQLFLLRTQALLVIQRILSRLDPDPHPFFLRCFLLFSRNLFRNAHQYSSRVDAVIVILEFFHSRQWKDVIDFDWCHRHVYDAVTSIMYCRWIKIEPPPDTWQLPFDSFVVALNFVSDLVFQLQKHPHPLQNKKAWEFVQFISDSIRMFTENDKETIPEFKKWLSDYIKFTNSHPGVFTALHATSYRPKLPVKVVQLLLCEKAEPNARDRNGYTPLHYVARNKNLSNVAAATKLLLDAGAHLDEGSNKGVTPLDVFKVRNNYFERKGFVPCPYLQQLTRTVLPLTCLSAQVIRKNQIPFQDDEDLPAHLIPFVQSHSPKCGKTIDMSNWFKDTV